MAGLEITAWEPSLGEKNKEGDCGNCCLTEFLQHPQAQRAGIARNANGNIYLAFEGGLKVIFWLCL